VALPFIVILCLCGVFCLAPLSLYLAWLGAMNRRHTPTVYGGGWDFACLLAGLSGFIVFGGGLLVAGLQSNFRYAARGNFQAVRAAWGEEGHVWGLIALGYLLVVAGAVALVIASRMRTLVVYNIDRERAEAAVGDALAEAGVNATRFGDVWGEGPGVVKIEALQGLRNVSVKVNTPDPRLAEELMRVLRKRLPEAPPAEESVGSVITTAAVASFVVMLCCMLLVGYFLYLAGR
jgi:hypothetical protein